MSQNLHVVLAPDQWRGNGPPGDLAMQVIHDRITAVPDDPGWVQVQGWRYYPDDPGPHRVVVRVRADVLPPELRPEGSRWSSSGSTRRRFVAWTEPTRAFARGTTHGVGY